MRSGSPGARKPHLAIYRMFGRKAADLGFARSRTAWWKRRNGPLLQGIHLHKFGYISSFRVHAAIHLADFEPEAPWLNGISSFDGWYEGGKRRYAFDYTDSSDSWQPCADELFAFARDILVPWFERWADAKVLLSDPRSPLTPEQKLLLARD